MSSSEEEAPTRRLSEKQRKTLQRREALARLKDASQSRAARQPRFLGADDDDEGEGGSTAVDFDRWDRQSAQRRRATTAATVGDSSARQPRAGSRSPSPLRDPTLSRAFDDLFDLGKDAGTGGEAGGKAEGGEGADDDLDLDGLPSKKRRVVAKLDEERLLGPSGFPLLRDHMKKIKLKGKGHERQDLKRVLTMYQLWSHQMYPKTNLRDTLQTVEKLCHKRAVQRALKEYRDEAKHGQARVDERDENDAFAGLPTSGGLDKRGTSAERPEGGAVQHASRDELLRDAGFDLDDLGNDEDLFADEEALLAELAGEGVSTQAPTAPGRVGSARSPGDATRSDRFMSAEPDVPEQEEEAEDDEAEAALREAEALLM
ncbi:hypothetical protein JCM10908_004452 [Rhodotorula pacifica]|uniref:Csm3p n=1 Tax=Rhodotorula pacifica TaxID=1495444 RepID=UPI003171FA2A